MDPERCVIDIQVRQEWALRFGLVHDLLLSFLNNIR